MIDTEDSVKEMEFSPDHFAPGKTGRPARGFLVSVLQIDTAANVQNYYDVASLTAGADPLTVRSWISPTGGLWRQETRSQ